VLSVLSIGAAAGLAIWFSVEHQARLRLADEQQALKQQLDQIAGLIATNEQLSNHVAQTILPQSLPEAESRELLRLRGEVGLLRQQTRELEIVRVENRQAHAALETSLKTQSAGASNAVATADYWPRDSWAFTGYASPDAALQTTLWAVNNGDLKAIAASMTGDVQKQMEAELGGKPDTEASVRAMDHVIGLKSVRILNREVQGDDTVLLTAALEGISDTQTMKLLMKRVGSEWKLSGLP
jgi:hypothetical protein